mmetsp:Transcript_25469/g.59294  ORF Transcript_25469/g.59294 Transcript_25469/m.59294 type:complete len:506 (+) Transcript_25469:49-1566(+)
MFDFDFFADEELERHFASDTETEDEGCEGTASRRRVPLEDDIPPCERGATVEELSKRTCSQLSTPASTAEPESSGSQSSLDDEWSVDSQLVSSAQLPSSPRASGRGGIWMFIVVFLIMVAVIVSLCLTSHPMVKHVRAMTFWLYSESMSGEEILTALQHGLAQVDSDMFIVPITSSCIALLAVPRLSWTLAFCLALAAAIFVRFGSLEYELTLQATKHDYDEDGGRTPLWNESISVHLRNTHLMALAAFLYIIVHRNELRQQGAFARKDVSHQVQVERMDRAELEARVRASAAASSARSIARLSSSTSQQLASSPALLLSRSTEDTATASALPRHELSRKSPRSSVVLPLAEGQPAHGHVSIVGKWTCVETWGLDDFLKSVGIGRLQRMAAANAPWPSWHFAQDGERISFTNKTAMGDIREAFVPNGPEYTMVDGQKRTILSKATWHGDTLVITRRGPEGRFLEERKVSGERLMFRLAKLSEDGPEEVADDTPQWGRVFQRAAAE